MMDVAALQAITAHSPHRAVTVDSVSGNSPTTGFAQLVERGVTNLNAELLSAERGVQALAMGAAPSVHGVMLQLEQARLAMQIASQVRSRVLEAYQDVMRMQV